MLHIESGIVFPFIALPWKCSAYLTYPSQKHCLDRPSLPFCTSASLRLRHESGRGLGYTLLLLVPGFLSGSQPESDYQSPTTRAYNA